MPKPEFTDSDLARWKDALSSGSSLRFDQGSAALVVHSLEELETYLQLDAGTITPSKETSQNETPTLVLTPGSAVYRADGLLPVIIEGGEPAPFWSVPGDFKLYLEPGEDEHTGLVRELLVGPFRAFDLDNDHELPPGNFLTDPEWDFVVGEPRGLVMQLIAEIGFDPNAERPDESKPRGETWLAERSNWETEVERLKEHITELEGKLAAATAPAPSALPENALELIQNAGGLSKPKAEAVLAALQKKPEA